MASAYESGERKLIPATLVYLQRDDQVLMIHRVGRGAADFHDGKWNGLGGKLEPGESPAEGAQRELREEAGIDLPLETLSPRGVVQFPLFKPAKAEDWVVFLFVAQAPAGFEPPPRCAEGMLEWVPQARLLDLPLWEGDRDFLPLILAGIPVLGTIWYATGKAIRSWVVELTRESLSQQAQRPE